ncbi:cadherin-like domain-containing protein, partial [Asticcacaulis biprosthecium]|uniref:cadherin-like domain-containing protein n=1 Tax=Asticcacaulis biprosthecium TaxID=76891 RepID=UPI00058D4DC3
PVLTGEPTDLGNPIANDSFAFTADDLLEGYTDVDNDELSISGTVTSNHGTVTDLGGGNYSFEPAEDYIGKVTFSYDVTDGHVTVDGALSTYVISDINDLVTTYNPLTQGAVNTVTAGAQNSSAVAQLSGGGYVVTWTGTDLSGSTASVGVKAQRFNNDGTTNGSEFQVNTTGTNQQYQPTITGLSGGGYVIAWASNVQDGSAYGVYFKQYDAAGTVVLAETRANTHAGSDQHQPVVTAFSDGSYMISWASASINTGDGSSFGIAAQKFNANGTTSGSEFLINVYTTLDQQSPAITALADNSFVVTWHSNGQEGSGNGYGIYAQRYNSSGVAQGEVHVNTTNAGNQRFPATAALDDGGYVIAWQDSATTDVHFQRYNASGVAQGTNTTANSGATSGTQTDPAIASLSTGGFVIVWTTS